MHGREVQAERERAKVADESPNFQPLIEKWGGVTIFLSQGHEGCTGLSAPLRWWVSMP